MPKKGSNIYNLSQVFFQLLAGFFLDSFLHLSLALIEQLLSFRDSDLELDPPVFPVDRGHDQGHTLLRSFLFELLDLLPVKKQLPSPKRFVILLVAVRVRRDVSVEQPNFSLFDRDVRVLQLDPPGHNAFDLGAYEHGSGLVPVINVIFVKCLAVGQDLFV